ncbi:MAG: adenylate/guanylate cyclase domain-containing protein [Actinomycetota bacterium]
MTGGGAAGWPGDLERDLLGGERRYTRGQVAARVGVDVDRARLFWRAMGFPDVGDDEVVFTDADVAALARVTELLDEGLLDLGTAVQLGRAMGRTTARLADWQMEAFTERAGDTGAQALDLTRRLLPDLEALLTFVWRRQLAAAALRRAPGGPAEAAGQRLAVGFADLVGFTRLSRRLGERELAEVVERFEAGASDLVSGVGARIVKTVGDEVLFVADAPDVAAEAALALAEATAADPVVPPVRVGLAYGPVLSRLGDVFGTTVNLASRLTALAPPGAVLVDEGLAAMLRADPRYQLTTQWRRRLAGLGLVVPVLLRRSVPGTVAGGRADAVG